MCFFFVSLTTSSRLVTAACVQKQVEPNTCEYWKATLHRPFHRSPVFNFLSTSTSQWDVMYNTHKFHVISNQLNLNV